MKQIISYSTILLSSVLLTACTSASPPTIYLDPQPTVVAANIGQGTTVAVDVIDNRPQTMEASYAAAKIDPSENVTAIFSDQINNALTAYQFVPANSSATATNHLTFKILKINYSSATGLASSNSRTEVAAEADVTNAKGTFMKTYRASNYSDNYLTVSHSNGAVQVNSAVTSILNEMFHDHQLMNFMTGS